MVIKTVGGYTEQLMAANAKEIISIMSTFVNITGCALRAILVAEVKDVCTADVASFAFSVGEPPCAFMGRSVPGAFSVEGVVFAFIKDEGMRARFVRQVCSNKEDPLTKLLA
eukprot:TRINITY_DN84460_c0_g1_i1.p2 TRINITY_DN84460_c0_g1~~TRINITY_DN84460_c0_g1_i1.p2  ORF type:complete len:112 (-),score=12.82 TRINITY_DN84460_c0_g1_i1:12-347(-)